MDEEGTLELGVLMKPAPRTPGEKVVLCGVGAGGMDLGGVSGAGPEEEALGRILGPPALQPLGPETLPDSFHCFPLLLPQTFLGDPRAPKLLQGCVVNVSHVSPTSYRRGCRGPQLSTSEVFLHPWGQFHSNRSLQHLTNWGPLPLGDGSQS